MTIFDLSDAGLTGGSRRRTGQDWRIGISPELPRIQSALWAWRACGRARQGDERIFDDIRFIRRKHDRRKLPAHGTRLTYRHSPELPRTESGLRAWKACSHARQGMTGFLTIFDLPDAGLTGGSRRYVGQDGCIEVSPELPRTESALRTGKSVSPCPLRTKMRVAKQTLGDSSARKVKRPPPERRRPSIPRGNRKRALYREGRARHLAKGPFGTRGIEFGVSGAHRARCGCSTCAPARPVRSATGPRG